MSLETAIKNRTYKRPPRLLDRIYQKLDPADQQTLVDLMADDTVSGYAIAGALNDLGHEIGYTSIKQARRDGWEPM